MFQLCPLEGKLGILGLVVVVIAGFLLETMVFAALGLSWGQVPWFVAILLWVVFSVVASLFVD